MSTLTSILKEKAKTKDKTEFTNKINKLQSKLQKLESKFKNNLNSIDIDIFPFTQEFISFLDKLKNNKRIISKIKNNKEFTELEKDKLLNLVNSFKENNEKIH